MNTYEGLFIFPERMNDDEVAAAKERALAEIGRQDGKVLGERTLGRRNFARPMDKQRAGVYARVVFSMAGDRVAALRGRYKLMDEVFRVQITCGDGNSLAWVRNTDEAKARPAAVASAD